jgi:hypothetical protein
VTLRWDAETDRVTVTVYDVARQQRLELDEPPEIALDVFHHPYTHAARRGLLGSPNRRLIAMSWW